MNPAIKGYFRLDNTRFGLIEELTVFTELGIRDRRYAQFNIRAWDNPTYEGEGVRLIHNGVSQWYVVLPETVLSLDAIEGYCVHRFLTHAALTDKPRVHVQRRSALETYEGDGGEAVTLRTTSKTLTEGFQRNATDHRFEALPVKLHYEVRHSEHRNEEVYSDTLSYRGGVPHDRPVYTSAEQHRRRVARHFIYKHLGIVLKKEK